MKTVADPAVLQALTARLRCVRHDSVRRWGTLSPHEMLCHLGDATDLVLGTRTLPPRTVAAKPLAKLIALWTPLPWPRGQPTNPFLNPKADGTKPSNFDEDRDRAIHGLAAIASAREGALRPGHAMFGRMSVRDWQRWAYRHTNHHLRQFGA